MKASTTELDAIQTAMDMESKTYDFYKSQGGMLPMMLRKTFIRPWLPKKGNTI